MQPNSRLGKVLNLLGLSHSHKCVCIPLGDSYYTIELNRSLGYPKIYNTIDYLDKIDCSISYIGVYPINNTIDIYEYLENHILSKKYNILFYNCYTLSNRIIKTLHGR